MLKKRGSRVGKESGVGGPGSWAGDGEQDGKVGRCCCRVGDGQAREGDGQQGGKAWQVLLQAGPVLGCTVGVQRLVLALLPPAPPNEASGCKCSPWAGPPAKELIKGHFGHEQVLPGAYSSLQHTVVSLGASYLTLISSPLCFIF